MQGFFNFKGGIGGGNSCFLNDSFFIALFIILFINLLSNPLKTNDLKAFLSLTSYLHLFPNYTSTLIMEDNKYLTEKQASQYFQISERTLGNYRREGRFI